MTKTTPASTIGERPLIMRLSKIFNSARNPKIILDAGAEGYRGRITHKLWVSAVAICPNVK